MKNILLSLSLALASLSLSAQQVMPIPFFHQQQVDTVLKKKKESPSRSPRDTNVIIYGVSSAEALQFEKLAATGSFAANIFLSKRFIAGLSFNFGTQLKKESADSVPLSLFYFPDVANTSLLGSFEFNFPKRYSSNFNHFSFVAEGSIQRRMIERDSSSYDFGIINVNAGPKYKWLYSAKGHDFGLTVGVFANHIAINRNNSDAFNTLFNDYTRPEDPQIKRTFNGISGIVSFQIDKVILFGRVYNDLNQRHDLAFTVGIKAAATFMAF